MLTNAMHASAVPPGAVCLEIAEDALTRSESMKKIQSELLPDNVEQKFASLEKEDQINRLLTEIKNRRRPQA